MKSQRLDMQTALTGFLATLLLVTAGCNQPAPTEQEAAAYQIQTTSISVRVAPVMHQSLVTE